MMEGFKREVKIGICGFLEMSVWEPLVHALTVYMCFAFRHEQPRGSGAGGARLQDAVPPGLPHLSARADAAVLEEGCRGATHLRVPASLLGGLLHSHRASVPTRRQPLNPSLPPSTLLGVGGWGKTDPISAVTKLWSLPSQDFILGDLYSFLSSTRAFQFHHHPLNTTLSLRHVQPPHPYPTPPVSELKYDD